MQIFLVCVIFVAMATGRRNLQSILFLNDETQGFLFMNDDKGCLFHSTNFLKTDLKTPKISKLSNFSSVVQYLLTWPLGV